MKNSIAITIAIILGVVSVIYLYQIGAQHSSQTIEASSSAGISAPDHDTEDPTALLKQINSKLFTENLSQEEVKQLLDDCAHASDHGWLNADQTYAYGQLLMSSSPAPMQGILKIRSVLEIDSNHIPTLELLGQLSIQSGQLEKARIRYQKLLSLQPENGGYRDVLIDICTKLGDTECLEGLN